MRIWTFRTSQTIQTYTSTSTKTICLRITSTKMIRLHIHIHKNNTFTRQPQTTSTSIKTIHSQRARDSSVPINHWLVKSCEKLKQGRSTCILGHQHPQKQYIYTSIYTSDIHIHKSNMLTYPHSESQYKENTLTHPHAYFRHPHL